MISSRDVAMPTNRAYGTCYAIPTNMALIRSSFIWTSVFMPANPMV